MADGYSKEVIGFAVVLLVIGIIGNVFANTQIQAAFTATAVTGAALLILVLLGAMRKHGLLG